MALIDTKRLPNAQTGNILNSQRKAQESVKSDPFANLNLNAIDVKENKTNYQNKNVVNTNISRVSVKTTQEKERPQLNSHLYNERKPERKTRNGRTLKTTKNGNTYTYEDVYNHKDEVTLKKEDTVKYLLRLPASFKRKAEQIAKQEGYSFNQLILRAVRQYISNK